MRGTRTITVLFTDIVGSTSLLAGLGPVRGDELLNGHFSAVRNALAVHRGREVKTLGDGVMAVFESANDAVACAVTVQRAAARERGERPEIGYQLRVGVSTGEALEQDGDVFGIPVVEGSRLCAAAAGGEILVADVIRILIGASIHSLEPIGTLELKGLNAPLAVCRVDWDVEQDGALRVALAEDSVLLREGIAKVLETEGMVVVLQAGDPDALLAGLAAASPHVVVLDVRMPPTHTVEGLLAAERIRAEHPEIGVLVLSAAVQPSAARRLLAAGTNGVGYMLKDRVSDIGELAAAIRTVASGGSAIDAEVITRMRSESAA
ncbi:MAG: response regulator [Solirubrobacteraceae bacterium]